MGIRDRLKERTRSLIQSTSASSFAPLRAAAKAADAANVLLGDPLGAVVAPPAPATAAPPPATPPRAAPVFLYVEWDSPGRDKIEALLARRQIPYQVLAVDHDEVMKDFIARSPHGTTPIVYVATDPIGGLAELEAMPEDELRRRVFGGRSEKR